MALTVTWQPNVGPPIVFNSVNYPIHDFDPDTEFSDPSLSKMQLAGEWPSFGYPGAMRIPIEGDILGANGADFWANRQAFLVACTPPNAELTARRHGTLTIADTDMAEPAWGYCRIIHRMAKLESLSPERCPYLVTFKAFVPYFTGLSSGLDVLIG